MSLTKACPDVGTTRVVSMPAVVVLPARSAEEPEDLPGTDDEVEAVDGGEVRAGIDLGQLDGADDAISRAVGHDLRG